jgi:glycosyltransferase involved in cell wall biosynthesis
MTRVAMLAYTHYGSDPRVRRQAEALTRAGHSVTVFCLNEGRVQRTLVDGVEVLGIGADRYRGDSPLAYLYNYGRFLLAAGRALRHHHSLRAFDLIQVHTMPDAIVFAALPLKRAGIPVLLDIHDLMPELFVSKFGMSDRHPVVKLLRWQERRSARFAHRCLAVHRRHRQRLAEHSGAAVTIDVIHNLPDPRWFPVTLPSENEAEALRIVYHGTVARRHGIEIAVKAIHAIHDQFPAARLDVYGDGDSAAAVAALIGDLNASSYIRFQPGMMPLEQLVPALQGAGIGVIPLLADAFTNYMLPTKLLEYVAMGIPVIASDLRSIRDYFSDRQIRYVTPGSVDDLAAALRQLLSDSNLRHQLATEAGAFYDRYRWSAEEQIYVSIVASMIEAHAGRSDGRTNRSTA